MPAKGTSKLKDRDCLVCKQTTRIAHLGIECCRACAVFYRRAKRSNSDFLCRSSSGRCPASKHLSCKRCRFDRIVTLLQGGDDHNKDTLFDTSSAHTDFPSTTAYPFLERARTQYNAMNFSRLNHELTSLSHPPHPLEISLEKGPFFQSDLAQLTNSIRFLLTAALEFGKNTFPEFAHLTDAEKWTLALNFFYRFRVFEGNHRANKYFPDNPEMYFISYAGYTEIPFNEKFLNFSGAAPNADIAGATEYMKTASMCTHMRAARELIGRVNPSEEEVIVVAVFMFWTIGDHSVSERITQLGTKYRAEILSELHAYYREKMGVDDYASRLGELMMLMDMFESTKEEMKQHFEVMRMFNIMTEDNFIYRLQKD